MLQVRNFFFLSNVFYSDILQKNKLAYCILYKPGIYDDFIYILFKEEQTNHGTEYLLQITDISLKIISHFGAEDLLSCLIL